MSEPTHQNWRAQIMRTSSRIVPNTRKAIVRTFMIATATAAVLVLSPAALAQAQFGGADEAKAMLLNAVAAVQADKTRALDMFNKGEGGFLDRDLHPFCVNVSDGKFVTIRTGHAGQNLGQDVTALIDVKRRTFGQALFAAAQKPDGEITEVGYLLSDTGVRRIALSKVIVTTRVGDLMCGVSYYPSSIYWTAKQARG